MKKSIKDNDESATFPRNAQTNRCEYDQLATALVSVWQEWTDPLNFATSFFSKQVENFAFQSSSHLRQSSETNHIWYSRWYPFQYGMGLDSLSNIRSEDKFSGRVFFLTSRMLNSSKKIVTSFPTWISRKTSSTSGDVNKVAVLKATIDGLPSFCNITLWYQVNPTHFFKKRVAAYVLVFVSYATKVNNYSLFLFFIFVVIDIIRVLQLRRTVINCHTWVFVFSFWLPSFVSSCNLTCFYALVTPRSIRDSSDNDNGSLVVNRFIINVCTHNLMSNGMLCCFVSDDCATRQP